MVNSMLNSLTLGQFMFLFVFCVVGGGVLFFAALYWWWNRLPHYNGSTDELIKARKRLDRASFKWQTENNPLLQGAAAKELHDSVVVYRDSLDEKWIKISPPGRNFYPNLETRPEYIADNIRMAQGKKDNSNES